MSLIQEIEPQIQEEQCEFRPGCGTVDQLLTPATVLEGAWQPVDMIDL